MALSPEIQAKLYAETDARFALATGVTHKIDPNNPIDQKLIPAWQDTYRKVLAQYQAGILAWTYDHPVVTSSLAAGDAAAKAAGEHLAAPVPASLSWAEHPAGPVLEAGKAATDHGAAAVAKVEANKGAGSVIERGARHGLTPIVQLPPALPDPELVRQGAIDVAEMLNGAGAAALGLLNDAGNAVAAIQVANAPAAAGKAHDIAHGRDPATDREIGKVEERQRMAILMAGSVVVGGIAIAAVSMATGKKSRRRGGGRRTETVRLKVAR